MGGTAAETTRDIVNPKARARLQAAAVRRKLDPGWIASASRAIARRLGDLPAFRSARTFSCYLALPREVQTGELIAEAQAAGRTVCVPAFRRELDGYALARLAPGADLKRGAFGVEEPAEPAWTDPADVDLMIVPCVAFDPYGRRLGHGGGHFDRLLSRFRGPKIALAFEAQRLAAVPSEAHDVDLDLIVTERAVYGPGAGRP